MRLLVGFGFLMLCFYHSDKDSVIVSVILSEEDDEEARFAFAVSGEVRETWYKEKFAY